MELWADARVFSPGPGVAWTRRRCAGICWRRVRCTRCLAEHRSRLFPDEMFEDLFPSGRGRPSVPADVIATVMVLQALEGLSDRQAVRQLETNIAWKAAAGLALADEAFHHDGAGVVAEQAARLGTVRSGSSTRCGR